jgi:hypothetical protein
MLIVYEYVAPMYRLRNLSHGYVHTVAKILKTNFLIIESSNKVLNKKNLYLT